MNIGTARLLEAFAAEPELNLFDKFKSLFQHSYHIEAFNDRGVKIFEDRFENIIVNEGLDEYLDKFWKGSTYTASHAVGLIDGTPSVAGADTMSSHAGWAEVVAYTESVREALTLGTVSSQSVDNSASKASFAINANGTTIGGAFISTDNTKSGTSGNLIGAGAFSAGDVTLNSGSTLNVTVTLTSATP